MRIFLIFYSATIIIASADAQRKSNITKPVVNLEKRPRTPVWHRPPEERRKLSIFPKNNVKFVVTPKPVSDEPKESSTKRPLMRKFIMQDKNEKGTWSFAPREPLMKTQRFTVTLAPPKSSNHKASDEMKSEESKKVPIVLSNIKTKPESSKHHNINRGNLIESMKMRKEHSASKNLHKVELNITKEDTSQSAKKNGIQTTQQVQNKDNKTLPTFGQDLIDVRTFNDRDIVLDTNETINKDQMSIKTTKHESLNGTTVTLNTELSDNVVKSRAVDLSEIKYPMDHDNNSLNMGTEGSDNHKAGQILNINDLEIMLEKIVNITEQSNISSPSDSKNNGAFVILNNETSIDEIPQFDVTKPNDFYDVITLSTDDKVNTNIQGSLYKVNEDIHPASETNVLNDKDITAHVVDTLIVSNLENLKHFIENDTVSTASSEMYQEQAENIGLNLQELKTNEPTNGLTTRSPAKDYKNNSDTMNALNLSLEIYESNMPLSVEEISNECDENNCNETTIGKINLTIEEVSNEELIDNLSFTDISNKSTSDASNDYAEERSNESYKDKINNLTEEISEFLLESSDNANGEQFSNDSSNQAEEELSNENFADKSDNADEISSDSIIENSFSAELTSNESSNITEEETSNQSYLIDDITNGSIETSEYLTEEQSSNESSSNTASEEISKESDFVGNYLNESTETSYNFTATQELLSDNSDNFTGERMLDEIVDLDSEQGRSIEEIAEEALINRFKRSNNIIEEESLPTTISGFQYTGLEVRLNHDLFYKNINA